VAVSEFVSLDGVIEDPSWTFQFLIEEQEKFKFDELAASDALLLGRVTYEGFAAAPHDGARRGTTTLRVLATGIRRHDERAPQVRSFDDLEEPLEWNNSTPIKGNVAEEVSRLKQQPGKDILVFGSGALVNTLMQHDLIDEYRLMVFPVVLESGERLFRDGSDTKVLRLVDATTFGSGVVVLSYQPDRTAVVDALRITRKFIGMLRERGVKKLDGWVEDAKPKPYDEVWA
jgi:dihydrofolate reductase